MGDWRPIETAPRLLRPDEAAAYLGISKTALRRLEKEPGFPKPIRISPRSPRWDRQALDSYLDGKARTGPRYVDPDEALGGSP